MNIMLNFLDTLDQNLCKSKKTFEKIRSKPTAEELEKLHSIAANLESYLVAIRDLMSTENKFLFPFGDNLGYRPESYKEVYKNALFHTSTPSDNMIELSAIDEIDLQGQTLTLPKIQKIHEAPPALNWFVGDRHHRAGIYICLCRGFYVRIPFPNVIRSSSREDRINLSECKYISREECQLNKKRISELYGSPPRECFYVHKNEKFNKISMPFRNRIENLGNHATLAQDIKKMRHPDIKRLLMYSLSDDLLAPIWYQNEFKNGDLILTNLDIY